MKGFINPFSKTSPNSSPNFDIFQAFAEGYLRILSSCLDELRNKFQKPIDMITIDSAEGTLRNQIYKNYSIQLHPIAMKLKIDMIDKVNDLLAKSS